MKKILHDLYHGRIPGWDSRIHSVNDAKSDEFREKTLAERRYLASVLSPKDFERFKTFESLHSKAHARRYHNIYINAFKLGVMLMCAVFMDDGEEAEK